MALNQADIFLKSSQNKKRAEDLFQEISLDKNLQLLISIPELDMAKMAYTAFKYEKSVEILEGLIAKIKLRGICD